MDEYTALNKLCEGLNIDKNSKEYTTLQKMFWLEVDSDIAWYAAGGHRRTSKLRLDCMRKAIDRFILWHKNVHEYKVGKISEFIATHRLSCSWVIFRAIEKRQKV